MTQIIFTPIQTLRAERTAISSNLSSLLVMLESSKDNSVLHAERLQELALLKARLGKINDELHYAGGL